MADLPVDRRRRRRQHSRWDFELSLKPPAHSPARPRKDASRGQHSEHLRRPRPCPRPGRPGGDHPADGPRHIAPRPAAGRRRRRRPVGRGHPRRRLRDASGADRRPRPPRRCGRRHLRGAAVAPGRPHGRTPQRRRHREAPVAGLPGARLPAAVRYGARPGLGRRRHQRLPRHVLRHVQPLRQRAPIRRRHGPRAHPERARPLRGGARQARPHRARYRPQHQPVHGRVRRGRRRGHPAAGADAHRRPGGPPGRDAADRDRGGGPAPPRPAPAYTVGPVRITAWRGGPAGPDDPLRTASPEARRAYENTDEEMRAVLPAEVLG